jgi:signal transduction histidine kinase/DNA-binding response OmpR family regulator
MASILIVEDRPIERKYLVTLLRSVGHAVTEASDGAEALLLARRRTPDLVISDILMPTIDGYEFVRQMRENQTLARTPVIFYTATYHEREALTLAQECGAEILTKPCDPKTILAKVDTALTGEPATHPVQDSSRFSQEHARLVSSTLAGKIRDLEASEHRMAAIVDVAEQLAAERDPRALMTRVCDAAREVTLSQHAAIGIASEDGTVTTRLVTSGPDSEILAVSPIDLSSAPFAPVLKHRRAVRLRNPSGRPDWIGLPRDDPQTYSCLIVPVSTSRRVIGYLSLRNKIGADEFTEADQNVAMTLATHAGIAYENARLYDELRGHAASLEQEVAERRRVEVALRENEARTQFALAAARMGVWEADFSSGAFTGSDALMALLGLAPSAAPTTIDAFLDHIHPHDRSTVREGFDRAIRESVDFASEFRIVWPDGSIKWMAGRARVVSDDEAVTRMIGVATDIAERKSLEDQFRHAQKMEAVGQLAGGVAHDFNNLLTAIRGYADLVQETLEKDDQRRADLDEIVRAADRATALTRQLLAFSRKQVLQPTLLDLNALVSDTTKMLRRLIGEDVTLVTALAPEPVPVRADAGQLEQILMNLAVNARDAMPQGGRLMIETSNVVLDDSEAMQRSDLRPGPYAMLAVTDSGVGMDAETRRRLFEPFFTTKERGRGTGLGLATVYGIVKQSGGYIWVYSEPDQGAIFKVYLPRAEDGGTAVGDALDMKAAPTGNETVLLVEDQLAVRSLSRLLLERAGYKVLDAADPAEAEQIFREHADEIDLLVTDVIMPGSSGPTLFGRLSTLRPDLKVLYMSGYTDDAVVHHAGLPAEVTFLQKPFTADGLMYKVREALNQG